MFLASAFVTNFVADAAYFDFATSHTIASCKDHGINAGTLLEERCVEHCYPDTMEAYDYADTEEDSEYVVRNTVCRCYAESSSPSAPMRKIFECNTKTQVWEKKKPILKCLEDYAIDSLSTCEEYCKRIDPASYRYEGSSGDSYCQCGGVDVCSDQERSGGAGRRRSSAVGTAFALLASTALTLFALD